jgi:ABC-type sugar transport system ATPase subunit
VPVTPAPPLLQARGIHKRFGGVCAVDGLDFTLEAGEVVALLGKNGAGKSTFIQILAGAHPAGSYGGQIELRGQPFRPRGVAEAEAAGVALVPQEICLAPELSVAETLFLDRAPTRHGLIDEPLRVALARRTLAGFDLAIDVRAPVGSFDLATQQLVVIARALSRNAGLLILDEPTAALTGAETRRLFDRLGRLKAQGTACIFVSHRLAEVFAIADRIVVMRDGRLHGRFVTRTAVRDEVIRALLGTDAAEAGLQSSRVPALRAGPTDPAPGDPPAPPRPAPSALAPPGRVEGGPPALEVRGLVVEDPRFDRRPPVRGLDLRLAWGEVLGLFGLRGAGCAEAAAALFGAWPGPVAAALRVDGRARVIRRPIDAVAAGLGLVAADRRDGLLPEHSIAENIALASLDRLGRFGFLDLARLRQVARHQLDRLAIRAPGIDSAVGTLSGGNQQKVQVARWLAARARILLLVEPTRGIDLGTRREIHQLWRDLAAQGHALLVVSSEAEELLQVCDRILVLRDGEAAAELPVRGAAPPPSEERLLQVAAGV